MANSDKAPIPEDSHIQFDSLNSDVVEPTDVVIDTTVRPMREVLRKRLKPRDGSERSHEPDKEPPSAP